MNGESDYSDSIAHMPGAHLQCRDFGHSWRPFTARWNAEFDCFESRLRCTRCRTVRNRYISRNGELLSSHYAYADGYLIRGFGRRTAEDRAELRLASIMRILERRD